MTTIPAPRPTVEPRRSGGIAGLVATRIVTELRALSRATEYVIGVVAVPIILYAMFGLPNAGDELPGGMPVTAMMMVAFSAYGTVSLALFTFGADVAEERGRGWYRFLRATPLPTWVHLVGKLAVGVVYTTLIVLGTAVLAVTAGGVSFGLGTWVAIWGVNVLGVLAFSTLGFAIAFMVRPKAASAICNLLFLPLSFVSGFFFPLSELPAFLSDIAPWLPTYHFGRLAWSVLGAPEAVDAWTGVPGEPLAVHLAWVLGAMVVFGALAIVAARRESVSRRT